MTDELARAIEAGKREVEASTKRPGLRCMLEPWDLRELLTAASRAQPPLERTEQEVRDSTLEEAARIAEGTAKGDRHQTGSYAYQANRSHRIAALIRERKSSPQGTVRDPGAVDAPEKK